MRPNWARLPRKAAHQPRRHRAVRRGRSLDRPRPPGRRRSESRAPGRASRRRAAHRSRPHDQQGVRRRHAGAGVRRAEHHARRIRRGARRRHRDHEPHAVSVDAADARWGHKMGHFPFVDAMYRDGFADPLSGLIMGETAEVLARQYGITREAVGSVRAREPAQGRGRAEGRPLHARDRAGRRSPRRARRIDDRDRRASAPRLDDRGAAQAAADVSEGRRARGIITAGSASGITDGGAALVLASATARRPAG